MRVRWCAVARGERTRLGLGRARVRRRELGAAGAAVRERVGGRRAGRGDVPKGPASERAQAE